MSPPALLGYGRMRRRAASIPASANRFRRSADIREPATDPVLEFIRRMWAVDHELQRVSKRMVRRIGLTAPQRLAVRFIGRHDGLTLGSLSALLHLHPGRRRIDGVGVSSLQGWPGLERFCQ